MKNKPQDSFYDEPQEWEEQRKEKLVLPNDLLEKLASAAHDCWSDWAEYFIDNTNKKKVGEWEKQIITNYKNLSTEDQLKDKQIVARYYGDIIVQAIAAERQRLLDEVEDILKFNKPKEFDTQTFRNYIASQINKLRK